MSGYPRSQRAERVGQCLGVAVRTLTFRGGRFMQMPVGVRVLLWTGGLGFIALLFFFALWFAVILVLAWIAINVMQRIGQPGRFKWEPTDPHDPRERLFYDPVAYNHDPDPRFEDPN